MALSIEDIFGHFNMDSGDSEKISTKQAGDSQETPLLNFTDESESHKGNSSGENEIKPTDIHGIMLEASSTEQLESNVSTIDSTLLNETHLKANPSENKETITKNDDIPDILASAYESAKSNNKQTYKVNKKRVHFNTEVETFTFEPELGINESYNYIEEFTIENVCADAFNEKRIRWKSESNLAIRNSKSCLECPLMDEWLRCDCRFHQMRNGCISIPEYSRLNDITDVPKKVPWPRLKRANSCLFRKKTNENEDGSSGSGSINRRLSISMRSLKMETKSWIDTVWTKVTKKKEESFLMHEYSWAGDTHVSMEGKKDKPRSRKSISSFFRKNKSEDENVSPNSLRPWKSVLNLKKEESFPVHEFSWIGDIINVSTPEKKNKELRSTRTIADLFRNKKNEDESGSLSGNKNNMRPWKSVQNLNQAENVTSSKFLKTCADDIILDSTKEPSGLKRKNSLFRKKIYEGECPSFDDQNRSSITMKANSGLRSWKSVQNLKFDSKSWMDKFVTKVMKK